MPFETRITLDSFNRYINTLLENNHRQHMESLESYSKGREFIRNILNESANRRVISSQLTNIEQRNIQQRNTYINLNNDDEVMVVRYLLQQVGINEDEANLLLQPESTFTNLLLIFFSNLQIFHYEADHHHYQLVDNGDNSEQYSPLGSYFPLYLEGGKNL